MRPVDRGTCGACFSHYKDARDPLERALGNYCSYCEWENPSHIEHVLPWEDKHTSLQHDWGNLLLACANCNQYKKNRQDSEPYDDPVAARAKYLWPDQDNTAVAFEYHDSNRVAVSSKLTDDVRPKAERTHRMLGFDDEKASCRRWRARKSAWTRALEMKTCWDDHRSPETKRWILNAAADNGFFSIWRVVFRDVPEIVSELNTLFPGTRMDCFAESCVFVTS